MAVPGDAVVGIRPAGTAAVQAEGLPLSRQAPHAQVAAVDGGRTVADIETVELRAAAADTSAVVRSVSVADASAIHNAQTGIWMESKMEVVKINLRIGTSGETVNNV